jgi:hypothetical protein
LAHFKWEVKTQSADAVDTRNPFSRGRADLRAKQEHHLMTVAAGRNTVNPR